MPGGPIRFPGCSGDRRKDGARDPNRARGRTWYPSRYRPRLAARRLSQTTRVARCGRRPPRVVGPREGVTPGAPCIHHGPKARRGLAATHCARIWTPASSAIGASRRRSRTAGRPPGGVVLRCGSPPVWVAARRGFQGHGGHPGARPTRVAAPRRDHRSRRARCPPTLGWPCTRVDHRAAGGRRAVSERRSTSRGVAGAAGQGGHVGGWRVARACGSGGVTGWRRGLHAGAPSGHRRATRLGRAGGVCRGGWGLAEGTPRQRAGARGT